GGRYHVLVRGLSGGEVVDRVEESASISRALVASRQWDDVLAVARSPHLRLLLSNTAEAGYTLDPSERSAPVADAAGSPHPALTRPGSPVSFPAKLLFLLRERFEAGRPGLTILPFELFEHNADMLRGNVLQLADEWKLS